MFPEPPDDLTDLKRLRQEVEGYLELDLPELADEAIADLSGRATDHPLVLDARLAVLMHRKSWPEAVEAGLTGCAAVPGRPGFFIHTAFCLHEMGRTEEAHLLLLSGPAALRKEPLYHYNMSCYLAVLGKAGEARQHLNEAFRLDESLRSFARSDRDLKGLWDEL
jgi:predicted Zn-dependent protease